MIHLHIVNDYFIYIGARDEYICIFFSIIRCTKPRRWQPQWTCHSSLSRTWNASSGLFAGDWQTASNSETFLFWTKEQSRTESTKCCRPITRKNFCSIEKARVENSRASPSDGPLNVANNETGPSPSAKTRTASREFWSEPWSVVFLTVASSGFRSSSSSTSSFRSFKLQSCSRSDKPAASTCALPSSPCSTSRLPPFGFCQSTFSPKLSTPSGKFTFEQK